MGGVGAMELKIHLTKKRGRPISNGKKGNTERTRNFQSWD